MIARVKFASADVLQSDVMGALEGIRVIEVGLLVQGPQASALLSDLGADVIKVELSGFGDQARWVVFDPVSDPRSGFFVACNRGKRSVALDLRTDDGAAVFKRLVAGADVVISNFKSGTMEGWGLGYDDLAVDNPGLVYGAGTTFGTIGPDVNREGADLAGQAAGGLIASTGVDGGDPTPIGVTIADHIASQHLAAGVMAALISRHRTGRGQKVETSLLGSQIWAQASEYTAYLLTGNLPGRANRGHPLIHGGYGIFRTSDGWVALVGVPPAARAAFYEAINRPDIAADERFAPLLYSKSIRNELFAELADSFSGRTTAEWCQSLHAIGVRYAPVRNYAEVVADESVYDNGYLVRAQHPDGYEVTVVGSPLRMSDTPVTPGVVAPELGQHTEEVLLEAGFTWDEIADLHSRNAFG